jgi:dTDP-4-dehydrorhamnose reductase
MLAEERVRTILIFGISSFVGSSLAEFFKKDFKVVGTYFSSPITLPGVLTVPCDVLNKDEVQLVLFAFKPDFAIYCAGLSSVQECATSEEMADALNTSGLFNVAEFCQRYKAQLCYISSSYVFGGEERKYIEMDIPDANTTYGKTQAAAEFYVQKTSLNYVIFRCCRLYGRSLFPNRPNFFESLQMRLRSGSSVPCDNFIKTGFLDVHYLAMVMKICFEQGVTNRLLQVSTHDVLSFYDFAQNYCRIFGDSSDLVSRGKWHFPINSDQSHRAPTENFSYRMDLSNIEGFLNIKMPTIEESLSYSFKRMNGHAKPAGRGKKGEGITFI